MAQLSELSENMTTKRKEGISEVGKLNELLKQQNDGAATASSVSAQILSAASPRRSEKQSPVIQRVSLSSTTNAIVRPMKPLRVTVTARENYAPGTNLVNGIIVGLTKEYGVCRTLWPQGLWA